MTTDSAGLRQRAVECTHDLAERETACADGCCPLCQGVEIPPPEAR